MIKFELWSRRGIAVVAAFLSGIIFAVLGGLLYIVLIVLAVVALTLSNFISAIAGTSLSVNAVQSLRRSISFFPSGFGAIFQATKTVWNS